jgi:flagellar M-ring protein FliF
VIDDAATLPAPEVPALEAPKNSEQLDNARNMAKSNPAAVAGIVRGWVNGEAA